MKINTAFLTVVGIIFISISTAIALGYLNYKNFRSLDPLDEYEKYTCPDCNVVLILIDTLRPDHMGCYGYHRNTTPNIDNLAQEGILFKNHIAQSSWTKPATASILTGLYPKNHKANKRSHKLGDEVLMISEILKDNYFNTYAFIANLNAGPQFGFNQGYDLFHPFRMRDLTNKEYGSWPADEMRPTIFNVIEDMPNKTRNFILIHYNDPHTPYLPKEMVYSTSNSMTFTKEFFDGLSHSFYKYSKQEKDEALKQIINAYDDEILQTDKQIGLLLEKLKEEGMFEKSVIIVLADHGEEFFEHESFEHGRTLYDEMIKIPLVIRTPRGENAISEKQVNQVDVLPTILSLLGINTPKVLDGENVFSPNHSPYSFSELDFEFRVGESVRSLNNKLIELTNYYPVDGSRKRGNEFRWIKECAEIEFEGDYLEVPLESFHIERELQVIDEGEVITEVKIKPFKQTINISFTDAKKRRIILKPKAPCERPVALHRSADARCVSFRMWQSQYYDLSKVKDISYALYSMEIDPSEKENRYYEKGYENETSVYTNILNKYRITNKLLVPNETEVEYDQDLIDQLRAMGYMT